MLCLFCNKINLPLCPQSSLCKMYTELRSISNSGTVPVCWDEWLPCKYRSDIIPQWLIKMAKAGTWKKPSKKMPVRNLAGVWPLKYRWVFLAFFFFKEFIIFFIFFFTFSLAFYIIVGASWRRCQYNRKDLIFKDCSKRGEFHQCSDARLFLCSCVVLSFLLHRGADIPNIKW